MIITIEDQVGFQDDLLRNRIVDDRESKNPSETIVDDREAWQNYVTDLKESRREDMIQAAEAES